MGVAARPRFVSVRSSTMSSTVPTRVVLDQEPDGCAGIEAGMRRYPTDAGEPAWAAACRARIAWPRTGAKGKPVRSVSRSMTGVTAGNALAGTGVAVRRRPSGRAPISCRRSQRIDPTHACGDAHPSSGVSPARSAILRAVVGGSAVTTIGDATICNSRSRGRCVAAMRIEPTCSSTAAWTDCWAGTCPSRLS